MQLYFHHTSFSDEKQGGNNDKLSRNRNIIFLVTFFQKVGFIFTCPFKFLPSCPNFVAAPLLKHELFFFLLKGYIHVTNKKKLFQYNIQPNSVKFT